MYRIGCCLPGKAADKSQTNDPGEIVKINLDILEECGFDYGECSAASLLSLPAEALEDLAGRFQANRLHIEACNCFIPGTFSILRNPEGSELLSYVEELFARMEKVGAEIIVFGSGKARNIPENLNPAEAREKLDIFLTRVNAPAAAHHITVVIEPLRSKETNFIHTVSEGAEIATGLNLSNIKLLADSYHMYYEEEPLDSLRKNQEFLRHIHIAEPPMRVCPGKCGGDYLNKFAEMLRSTSYCGRVSAECSLDLQTEGRQAAAFMRKHF